MKKWVVLCIILLVSWCPANVQAATGNITIRLQENANDEILYAKVATMVDGLWKLEGRYKESAVDLNAIENAEELEMAAKSLRAYVEVEEMCREEVVLTEREKTIVLQDLEEGLYLITSGGNSTMEMLPTLVSVPGWTGEEMTYDVTLIPKYGKKISAPDTGWDSYEGVYIGLLLISFIIIMGLSCHNRFKCGKIPFKYSEMGGYTNGNDNDTKNPRCPRRIGFSGCRSVN